MARLPTVSDELAELQRELRADVPPGIATLPLEDLRHLTSALAARRAAQLAAANEAIDNGLGFLPRVLRTVVRKALMG
jgi:hypothetical protein